MLDSYLSQSSELMLHMVEATIVSEAGPRVKRRWVPEVSHAAR